MNNLLRMYAIAASGALAVAALSSCTSEPGPERPALHYALDKYFAELPRESYGIHVSDLPKHPERSYRIIDLRSAKDYDKGHVPNAFHIPYDELTLRISELPRKKDIPILLYCDAGAHSPQVMMALRLLGYTEVYQLVGGFKSWQGAGRAITPGWVVSTSLHVNAAGATRVSTVASTISTETD